MAEYFSYSFGGLWGVVIVFLAHVFINGCSLAVSLYLAFSLTQQFSGHGMDLND